MSFYNDINFEIAYADLKGTEMAEIVKEFAMRVMEGRDCNLKRPVHCRVLIENHELPEQILEFVKSVKSCCTELTEIYDFIGALVYDTWKHQNYDIKNLFSYHLETLYGIKNITYKNEHPTLHQLETIRPDVKESYIRALTEGKDVISIMLRIVMDVAHYVLEEDFIIFFNENFALLHEDMQEAFWVDAKNIFDELKAS